MAYTALKNELEQLLKEDLSNRSSLQEMRRNVFLSSETAGKREKELQEKESLIASLHSRIEKESATLQTKDERIAELENELELLRVKNKEYSDKLSADAGLWDEVNKLTVENNHFATKIRDLILHIDGQNEKEERLSRELTQSASQVKSLNAEKEKLKQELEKITQQKLFAGDEQEKIAEENAMLKQKNELMEMQLNDAKFLIHSQNANLESAERSLQNLKQEFNQAIDELYKEKALIVNDNATLVADHDLAHYDNELLKGEIESLKVSFEEFSVNKHKEIEALGEEKGKLGAELEMLKSELTAFTGKEEILQASFHEERETLNQEIEKLNSSFMALISESRQKTETLEFEKNNLLIQLEDLNRQLLEHREAKAGSSEKENEEFISKLFKQIDALNDEKLQLTSQREEMEEQAGVLQQRLADLGQVIENQSSEIKNLEDRNKQIKLAQALVLSSKDKTATKLKINELVREIDKCIALLSV